MGAKGKHPDMLPPPFLQDSLLLLKGCILLGYFLFLIPGDQSMKTGPIQLNVSI